MASDFNEIEPGSLAHLPPQEQVAFGLCDILWHLEEIRGVLRRADAVHLQWIRGELETMSSRISGMVDRITD